MYPGQASDLKIKSMSSRKQSIFPKRRYNSASRGVMNLHFSLGMKGFSVNRKIHSNKFLIHKRSDDIMFFHVVNASG